MALAESLPSGVHLDQGLDLIAWYLLQASHYLLDGHSIHLYSVGSVRDPFV